MRHRNSTVAVAFVVIAGLAMPSAAEPTRDEVELRRVENVTVEIQIESDLPERCVGSPAALKDLAQLILTTSRIPVLQDGADASHLVTWNFRAPEADPDGEATAGPCVTIGELGVTPQSGDEDGATAKIVAFESSFEAVGRTRKQVSEKIRRSVSRGTTELAREILKAKESAE